MTKCTKDRYGTQQAQAAVERQPGSFSYRCNSCDGTHIGTGDKTGKLLEMSNNDGKVIAYFQGEITGGVGS